MADDPVYDRTAGLLRISNRVTIADAEVEINAIRAQGPGGQNVNKVSNAVHLRFDIRASSLPEVYKERLLALNDRRVSADGVVVIKAQAARSLEKNREDALQRLAALIRGVAITQKARKATRPTRASQRKRLDGKAKRGRIKALRGKPVE